VSILLIQGDARSLPIADQARAIFERLQSSANPQIAAAATHQLEELATVKKYGISPGAPKRAPQSSPFDELEQEAQKRAQAPDPSGPDKRPTQFVKGTLTSVDCSRAPAAVLTVNTGSKSLKLRTADYKSLLVIGEEKGYRHEAVLAGTLRNPSVAAPSAARAGRRIDRGRGIYRTIRRSGDGRSRSCHVGVGCGSGGRRLFRSKRGSGRL